MIVLGLNGGYLHDASACIVKDGELIAYAEEERLTKVKHAFGQIPVHALLYCLNKTKLSINDIDSIGAAWITEVTTKDTIRGLLSHSAISCRKKIPVNKFDHHLAHGAAGYFTSGFEKALILVVDGNGENVSVTIAYGDGNKIEVIKTFDTSQSLGFFYTGVGNYLGFNIFDEGKMMGLASYGEPVYSFPIELTDDGYSIPFSPSKLLDGRVLSDIFTKKWIHWMIKEHGDSPNLKIPYAMNNMTGYIGKNTIIFDKKAKDIAASAQKALETVLLHIIKVYTEKLNCRNLVMSGGVALNCSANGVIQQSGLVDDFYIMPAPNDGGACIGAAMLEMKKHMSVPHKRLTKPYWGSEYCNDEIKALLEKYNLKYEYVSDISGRGAELLAENKILGWFQGASEMGPRALGNRSIIANPTIYENLNRVNNEIKFREIWRPLAPSVLDEERDWLVENDNYSPYMLKAFKVKAGIRDKVPAIVHVDQSTRPQTVRQDENLIWHSLIKDFYQITEVPLILNTSLNVQGKPICESPYDALQTFFLSGMDNLIMGNYILSK